MITSGLIRARVIAARGGGGGGGGELHLAGLRGAWRHGAHGSSLVRVSVRVRVRVRVGVRVRRRR